MGVGRDNYPPDSCEALTDPVRALHDGRENHMRPEVENRGTAEVPFGYVYLEGTRVGFANAEVWETSGYYCSNEILEEAADILQESFGYGWYFEEIDEDEGDGYYDDEDEEYDSYYGMDDEEDEEF